MNHHRPVLAGLLLVLSLLSSCSAPRRVQEDGPSPFVFRRLDLRQQDPSGRPAWELTSPEARYDLTRHLARAVNPTGLIYRKGEPLYRLEAASGIVINDGEVIQLEGGIRLQRLGSDPVVLRASRVRWIPSQHRIELDRHPEARDRYTRLRSDTARLLIDRDRLELRGQPILQQRQIGTDPRQPLPPGRPQIQVKVASIDWGPKSGLLNAKGPVRAIRLARGGAPRRPAEESLELQARSLAGNTLQQRLVLEGPVTILQRPATQLRAGTVGLDLAKTLASGEGGCLIQRPQESLTASQCSWNWRTQAISAAGLVEFRRGRPAQLSRGSTLVGQLGEQGRVTLTAPGSRVVSQFRLPSNPKQRPQPQMRRSRPEPIRL